jgi:hypothetical protein
MIAVDASFDYCKHYLAQAWRQQGRASRQPLQVHR